jgi:hypothetical protein
MARARNIKPGFFTNGDLLECQPLARLLFAGLWCEADRRGILEDRPKTLKVKILPGDDCDVDELLNELSVRGFVVRYQVGEVRCLFLPGFNKHQNPHVKETDNTLPAPDGIVISTVQAPVKHSVNRADSLIPHPDSLIPQTPKPTRVQYAPEFEELWQSYPSGCGAKNKSYDQWRKVKDEHDAIMVGLAKWHQSDRWHRGVVKACELWIRDRMWENPPPRYVSADVPHNKGGIMRVVL